MKVIVMVTVMQLVKDMVRKRPFIEEALARGIINYGSLADELKPEIEAILEKEVKHSAVMMALRRTAENIEKTKLAKVKFDKNTDITLKSNLFEITVQKTPTIFQQLQKLYQIVDFNQGDSLTITQGQHEVTIISNKKYRKRFEKVFEKEKVVKVIENLGSLSVMIPLDAIEQYGLFYIVTRELSWENINIIELVSTLREMTLILDQKDVTSAFDIMQRLVVSGKETKKS
jgi:aspartokinase